MADPSNPFAAIFSTPEAVERQVSSAEQQRREVGHVLRRVFLISPTVSDSPGRVESRASRPRYVVALPGLARDLQRSGASTSDLDLDSLAKGVAERLQMDDPLASLVRCHHGRSSGLYSEARAVETCNLTYLAHSYARACQKEAGDSKMDVRVHSHVLEECKKVIVEMCGGVLMQMAHYERFVAIFIQSIRKPGEEAVPVEFFYRIAEVYQNDPQKLNRLFEPPLGTVTSTAPVSYSKQTLHYSVAMLEVFGGNPVLAKVMVNSMYWTPQGPNCNGKSFETKTILGRVLRPSSVPNSPHKPSEHFPLDVTLLQREVVEGRFSVQADQDAHIDQIHKVFCRLLRAGQEIKSAVIRWLVQCLEANKDRGKMMARMQPVMDTSMSTCASDGFFHLCWIMLKLAAPFAKQDAPLIRSIDPLYCLVKASESVDAQLDFRSETRMSPQDPEEGDLQPTRPETEFNFITQCFFLTHTTLTLGLSQIMQRFVDLMGLYERTLKSLQNIAAAGGEGGPLYDRMQTQFHLLHSQIHGFKAHMDHPNLQELCLTFLVTTARWLVWLATQRSHDPSSKLCDPALDSPDSLFPLPTMAPPQMRAVPECLVDNISHFVAHLRRSKSDLLRNETHLLGHLITFATVFMGSPLYIKNPHTRANISQLVFLMIPPTNSPTSTGLIPSEEEPQQLLFEGHKVATAHLVRMLMRIFVDIEFTGDSMEFEAKFQYRIPMYKILKFVWKLPTYQTSIDVLTTEAVDYDGSKQEIPIFLRFINMIINDATVQLDEGLENLVLIGELQRKRQSEWDSYNDEQKKEHQQKLQEASVMASNRNQLASYTVDVLELITRELQAPFVIPSMVDRVSAMLNYVLKQLVGPKRRQLNVEDMEKFHFKPKELVSSIVAIYVNLGQNSEFCRAVPQDGRSFSIELLEEAARIMRNLGYVELMEKMTSLIDRVQKYSNLLQMEESALDDAPEEFLDPVTSELMKEPVRLPTSGVTMDKSNIIRHLFSDGTDPFNRSPLTADMLEPDDQLRQRILDWRSQKLAHLTHSLPHDALQ